VGTVIDPKRFVFLTRHPLSVVLGLATQFTVMPAAAFLISRLAGFEDDVTLGFIIVGCAPGAMTSNVLTYLARGDTAFSVTLTTLASILAVGLTPTLVKLLAGAEMGITADEFWSQLWTIAWTVAIPLVGGLALRVALPKGKRLYETFSPAVAVLAIVIICCFVIQKNHEHLAQSTGGIAMAVIAVNGLGFGLGNLLGRLYRLTPAQRITLTIEIGMQNAGMGVVLAVTTFKDQPRVAIPSAFFTIWCIVTAAALIAFLKKHRSEP
jgi:BASS family bile acid:Na+ symporter